MATLQTNPVVVYSLEDFSTALRNNNGFDYIQLGADIIMSSRIIIHSSKTSLVIDGTDPEDAEIRHTLTGGTSDSATVTINHASRITFQNINLTARNYFGIPRVTDGAAGAQVTVLYQSVRFRGPQMIWHPSGYTRMQDCDVTIVPGSTISNETAEVRWLELGGKVTIDHSSTGGNAAFLFYRADPSLTILENADVSISTTREFMYRDSGSPRLVMEPRSRFMLTTQLAFSRYDTHRLASFSVGEQATFRYLRTSSAGLNATMCIEGALSVNKGANFYMESDYPNGGPLIRFLSGGTPPSIRLDRPRCFALYNSGTNTGAAAFSLSAQTEFSFSTGQVNFWPEATPKPAQAGGIRDVAPGRWYKAEWNGLEMTGTAINSDSATGTVLSYTNLTPEEIDPASPLSMLQLDHARVFSAGQFPLMMHRVICQERRIKGQTDPEANVLVGYTIQTQARSIPADVEQTGDFSANTQETELLPVNTLVTVASNIPFLIQTVTALALDEGVLEILEAPETIRLLAAPFGESPPLLPRLIPDAPVVISDTRVETTPWTLWVSIGHDLQTEHGDVLERGLVFLPTQGEMVTLTGDLALIHTDGPPYEADPERPGLIGKVLVWEPLRGLLGCVRNSMRARKEYSTMLRWEVRALEETQGEETER